MSELFTELSDQQQELVAGGSITLINANLTSFNSNTEVLGAAGGAASGPGGSAAVGEIAGANQEIHTTALNFQFGNVL